MTAAHEHDMVVCTLNELKMAILSSSEWLSLSKFTLLIIDECHNSDNTKKNSPYKNKNERQTSSQVIGLTASPGAGENPQGEV